MDRLDHVKIVSTDPAAIDRFRREVLDIPEGWPIGSTPPAPAPPGGALTMEGVLDRRGGDATASGFITGSTQSRQFQVFRGERPQIWAVAIGTREAASNIVQVNRGATETGDASAEVLNSAKALTSESTRLRAELDRFMGNIRAA